jgi:ribonuclease R
MDQMLEPRGLGRWLRRLEGHPKRAVLEMLLLRSLKQAVYDIVNVGHFGLASESYLHFTSPIRRYPDLEVHRAVKHLLRGGKPDVTPAAVEALRAKATQSSQRERAAMEVEREVVDLYRTLFMRDRIGQVFEGTVTALVGSGLYITLDHPFVDVLLRFEAMGPDHYEATEDELGVVGLRSGDSIGLGDRVVITIDDVAVLRRTVYARRVPPESLLKKLEADPKGQRGRGRAQPPARGQNGARGGRAQRPAGGGKRGPRRK